MSCHVCRADQTSISNIGLNVAVVFASFNASAVEQNESAKSALCCLRSDVLDFTFKYGRIRMQMLPKSIIQAIRLIYLTMFLTDGLLVSALIL